MNLPVAVGPGDSNLPPHEVHVHDEFYAVKINKLLLIFYMHAYAGFVLKLTASAGGKIAFPPYKGTLLGSGWVWGVVPRWNKYKINVAWQTCYNQVLEKWVQILPLSFH